MQTALLLILLSLSVSQMELAYWVSEFEAWKKERERFFSYFEQRYWKLKEMPTNSWKNRRPRYFEHMEVPSPPAWLERECITAMPVAGSLLHKACQLLSEYKDDLPTQMIRRQLLDAVQQKEQPRRTMFIQRVHIDGGWTVAHYPSPHIYGVIGMHVGLVELGRWQIYLLPGAMVANIPDGKGGRDWKPAITWGASFRLFEFKPFWSVNTNHLHLNISPMRIIGLEPQTIHSGRIGSGSDLVMVGFSITPF